MLKTLAIVAALTLGAGSAMAAEVGVRHSAGGSNTNITGGRSWSSFEGSRQGGFTYSGEAATEKGNTDSVRVGGNASGGFGVADTDNNGRGAACERGKASFCNIETSTVNTDTASSQYAGGENFNETYKGGSSNNFSGSSWSTFSETSTFAR